MTRRLRISKRHRRARHDRQSIQCQQRSSTDATAEPAEREALVALWLGHLLCIAIRMVTGRYNRTTRTRRPRSSCLPTTFSRIVDDRRPDRRQRHEPARAHHRRIRPCPCRRVPAPVLPIASSNSSPRRSATRTRAAPMRARRRNSSTGLRRRASRNSRRSRACTSRPTSRSCSARDPRRPRNCA